MRCHREGRARDFRTRGWWSAETIDRLVKERVGADPEGLALVDPPNTTALVGRDPVRWTWSRLDERVDVLASFLLARGVQAGDVVAVQLPNCSALVQAFLAIVRIGAVVTPFPVSYREHEMGPMCRRTGAVGVITTSRYGGRELAGAALGLGAAAPTVRFVVARGDDEPAGALARSSTVHCGQVRFGRTSRKPRHRRQRLRDDLLDVRHRSRTESGPALSRRLAGDRGRLRPGRRSHERRRPAVAVPDDQHGSAPLSPWLVHTWAERYGIDITNFFGSNEGTAPLSGPIDLPDPEQRASFFPNYASGPVTEPGRPGELHIAGRTVFAGSTARRTSSSGAG
jgi:hypothetical protein